MDVTDKETIPGYIYFRDNGMDYKIGLTNNLVVRGRAYKTENPRDTIVDYFFCETYVEAEAIETEMKQAARSEGLCAFDNSDEWLERTVSAQDFWNRFVREYAKKTYAEWDTDYDFTHMTSKRLRIKCDAATHQWHHFRQLFYDTRNEKEEEINKLNASLKGLKGVIGKLRHNIEDLERENRMLREGPDINKTNTETLIPHSFDIPSCIDDF